MTIRAPVFTVKLPWWVSPGPEAYTGTNNNLLLTAAPAQPVGVEIEDVRPAPQARQLYFPFPNVALLNFAQLRVPPVGVEQEDITPRPPPHQLDFQFPNITLLNIAQLQVASVGVEQEDIRPAPRARQLDFQFPNIALLNFAQLRVPPVGVEQEDIAPQRPPRQLDFQYPNIALASVTFVFRTPLIAWPAPVIRQQDTPIPNLVVSAVVASPPLQRVPQDRPSGLVRPLDFQLPNVALQAFAQLQVKPFGPRLEFIAPASQARHLDVQPPNLPLIQPVAAVPFTNEFFDRPAPQVRQQDFIAPNLLAIQPVTVAPAIVVWGAIPQPWWQSRDALPPNLLTTTLAAVVSRPVISLLSSERPRASVFSRDFQFPNVALSGFAQLQVTPVAVEQEDIRPAPQIRQLDFRFPNVALAPTTFVFRAPLIAWPAPVIRAQDVSPPNLAISTVAAAARPVVSPIFDRPVQVALRLDTPLPNLLTTTLFVAPAAAPFVNQYLDRPAPQVRTQDTLPPNLVLPEQEEFLSRAPLDGSGPCKIFYRAQELQAPNLVVTAPPAVKPGFSTYFINERPLPRSIPQDTARVNILPTLLATVQGTPIVAPPFLMVDRPQAARQVQEHVLFPNIVLGAPVTARHAVDWLVRARRRGQRQGLGR